MNLLVKIRNCGALLLILAIFNSCEEKGGFGIATDDVAPVEFVSTDVGVQMSVVQLDSIKTSDISRALFGKITGTPFANPLTAKGYIGLSANVALQPGIDEVATLDSVFINFNINYLFDTSANNRNLEIELYDIAETFKDTTYISTNTLAEGTNLLASGQFEIVDLDSTYTMRVDPSTQWVQDFFQGVKSDNENFISQSKFEEYFPGFVIKSTDNVNNVFGLQTGASFEIIFYYSEPNADNSGIAANDFKMSASGMPNFYNLEIERAGTAFAPVTEVNTQYDNTSVVGVQAGAGLVTKVDISDLENFSNSVSDIIINSAVLEIGPIEDFPNGQSPPVGMALFLTDDRNTVIPDRSSFRSIQSDGSNPLASGNPVNLIYNPETKMYEGSITSFAKAYYDDVYRRNYFFLYPSEMTISLKGFTLTRDKINLKIFYSELR